MYKGKHWRNSVNYWKSLGTHYINAIGNKSQRKNAKALVPKAPSTEEISEAEPESLPKSLTQKLGRIIKPGLSLNVSYEMDLP